MGGRPGRRSGRGCRQRQHAPAGAPGMRQVAGRAARGADASAADGVARRDPAVVKVARLLDHSARRTSAEGQVPGHQGRRRIILLRQIRHLQLPAAFQFLLYQGLQCRQAGTRGGGTGTGHGFRRLWAHRCLDLRPAGRQRQNPGRGRGRCRIVAGIRTAQPFPRPCSAVPPACAAGVPIRCASRAGGCRCAAARAPARRRARHHCDAAVPAAPRLRG